MPENLLKKRKAYQAIKATQAKQALLNKRKVGAVRGGAGGSRPGERGCKAVKPAVGRQCCCSVAFRRREPRFPAIVQTIWVIPLRGVGVCGCARPGLRGGPGGVSPR